jgi:hypothetical protein
VRKALRRFRFKSDDTGTGRVRSPWGEPRMADELGRGIGRAQNSAVAPNSSSVSQVTADWSRADQRDEERKENSHELFHAARWATSVLLLASILVAVYAAGWEYSTRRYLKGFSDAIVPASGSPEQKVQAILNWMSQGPARQTSAMDTWGANRDPLDTLNYRSLLQVCGTATNAFINLADSAGVSARRILLLDAQRRAKHVDAEVLVNERWIVVDPTFRVVLEGADGTPLTRGQLTDPATFAAATRRIPHYNPSYSFESTVHVRLSRVPFLGHAVRQALDSMLPGWEDLSVVSLILERESLALVFAAMIAVLVLIIVRVWLRWYGERHLHVRMISIHQQLRRAFQAFLETPS